MASAELQTVIDMLNTMMPLRPDLTIEQQRERMEAATAVMPLPDDVKIEPVDAGGVPAEWTTVPESTDRTILYVHGGGYVVGSVRTHRGLVAALARAARARVLSLDYRLGPEHPFPAAVDDATAAYRYLLGRGVKPAQIAISGDSAGGGLTVATLLALRDAKQPLPACGAPISPWLDLSQSGESMTTKAAVDPMVQREHLQGMATAYLNGADPRDPLASPLFANLAGLPPLLVQVGTSETLLDDSTRFAERAKKAGVDVTLEKWDDMIHVFHAFHFILPEAREAIDRLGAYVREHTAA